MATDSGENSYFLTFEHLTPRNSSLRTSSIAAHIFHISIQLHHANLVQQTGSDSLLFVSSGQVGFFGAGSVNSVAPESQLRDVQ